MVILRDGFTRSGAAGGSSAYRSVGVDSTTHFPGDISNRDFPVEYSMQLLQDTTFQSLAMGVPSYITNTTFQSYEGNVTHPPRLQHATPLSGGGASARSSANYRYTLDAGPPAQISGGIPDRNSMLANPVPLQPDTVSQPFNGNPSHGSMAIAPGYEGDAKPVVLESHTAELSRSTSFYSPVYRHSDYSHYGVTPPHPPSPPSSSILASRTEILHSSAHQPAPSTDHAVQAASFRGHGSQQSASPPVFYIDGCFIDEDDLADQGTNDGNIIVGQCLRNDSPCGLWVKADKGSIKRHAHKWHGVARGGDINPVSCTWAECHAEMQKSAVPRHTLCKHFGETFQCKGCSKTFTRDHVCRSHVVNCTLGAYGYGVSYNSITTRVINVRGMP
ncbi:hypothetical protein F4604DRAFT_320962 [Suillus subluteus]|nr:hypothetical protein F4604DRAFT_320962 [Suillus subluteus]